MLRLRKSAFKTPGKSVQVLSVEKYASRLTLPFIEGAGLDASAFAAVRELLGDGPAIAESHRIAQQVGLRESKLGFAFFSAFFLEHGWKHSSMRGSPHFEDQLKESNFIR